MKKISLGILVLAVLSMSALAVPSQLTYSGRLLQNGALVNSSLPMDFMIYTDPIAGTLLWQQGVSNVEVNQGIYSVILGSTANPISPNVFVTDNAYLQVVVNSETLSPRTKINSVGYALQAGGLSRGGVQAVVVSTNGNVGIGTTIPATRLQVTSSNTFVGISVGGSYLTHSIISLTTTDAGGQDIGPVLGFGGERTPGVIGNPGIFAGIRGAKESSVIDNNGYLGFYTTQSGIAFAERMRIASNGNVGIGTATPVAALDVTVGNTKHILGTVGTTGADFNYFYLKLFEVPDSGQNNSLVLTGRITTIRSNDLGVSATSEFYISRGYTGILYFNQLNQKGDYGPFQLVKVADGGKDWVALLYDCHGGAGIESWNYDVTLYNSVGASALSLGTLASTSVLHSALTNTISYPSTIITNGNVGIGGAPSNKLDVYGNILVRPTSGASVAIDKIGSGNGNGQYWGVSIRNDTSDDSTMFGFSSSTYSTGGNVAWIGNSNAFVYFPSSKQLRLGSGIGTTPLMTLAGTARVGINTTNPGNDLDVNGGVSAKTYTTSTAWTTIPSAGGWTSVGAACRRVGSFIQFKGYFTYSSPRTWWEPTGLIVPAECRPSITIGYPSAGCWDNSNHQYSGMFNITPGTGAIELYSNGPLLNFSITGTYPAD
ncbi:MAG: hypothetical protein WC838_02940 [Candidatus Margulisiibacteriota bacterium]